jgi:hypothetical protein
LAYKEIDVNNDNISEHIYRTGAIVRHYIQKIHIYNQDIHHNISLLEQYKENCERIYGQEKCESNATLTRQVIGSNYNKEWESTQDIDAAIYRAMHNKKSLDILYPDNSIKIARGVTVGYGEGWWSLYKTSMGVVMVQIPWGVIWQQTPEFLVFSLHRDKLATLECIMMPKEWQ